MQSEQMADGHLQLNCEPQLPRGMQLQLKFTLQHPQASASVTNDENVISGPLQRLQIRLALQRQDWAPLEGLTVSTAGQVKFHLCSLGLLAASFHFACFPVRVMNNLSAGRLVA
jgi:hypothetical protein